MWLKALLGFVLLTAGFGAGLAFDRRPDTAQVSMVGKLLGASLGARLEQAQAAATRAEEARASWEKAWKEADARLRARNTAAAGTVDSSSKACDARGSASYDSGYAMGVSVGRRQCHVVPQGNGGDVRAPGDGGRDLHHGGGVQHDLSTDFNRNSYRP